MTHLVMQESVKLLECLILGDMTFWPQMSYYRDFQGLYLFQCKMSFAYTMKIRR